MIQMVRPVDTDIVATTTLMQPGMLKYMDTETSHISLAK